MQGFPIIASSVQPVQHRQTVVYSPCPSVRRLNRNI
jgi:hypothetical protein